MHNERDILVALFSLYWKLLYVSKASQKKKRKALCKHANGNQTQQLLQLSKVYKLAG